MKNLTLLIFTVLVVFFQSSVEGFFFAGQRMPDLALAFVITLVIANGFEKSVWWIILTGLLTDVGSATVFGMTAVSYLLIGWALDFFLTFADIRSRKTILLGFLAVAAATAEVAKDLLIALGLSIKSHYLQQTYNYPINMFSADYLLKIIYTIVAAYAVYYVFRRISRALFIEPMRLAKRKF